jgi:hypothetical protein
MSRSKLVNEMVDKIVLDMRVHDALRRPRKYLNPDEQLAQGGILLDMLMPNDKPLGECTFGEIEVIAEAYQIIGERLNAEARTLRRKATSKKREAR